MGIRINGKDVNVMDIFDKLQHYLEKNSYATKFEIIRKHILLISFKIDRFDFYMIKGMFHHWGFKYEDYLKSFRATPISFKNIKVDIWLSKIPETINCNHEFLFREDWNSLICSKCGYFSK